MQRPTVIDLHQDLLLGDARGQQTSFAQLERSAVRLVVATAFPEPPEGKYFDAATTNLIEQGLQAYRRRCEAGKSWALVSTASDVDRVLVKDGPRGLLLHVEGLHVVPGESTLERWYDLGWRSLGLVWNLQTPLGGGTTEPHGGLTRQGRDVIAWLQSRHMIVDLAHMNAETFWDAVEILHGPLVVSHGNAAACCASPRNLADDQLRVIADRGGVVGLFFSKRFVTTKAVATLDDILRHVDHLRSIMGIDAIALGTDFGGITSGTPEGLASVDDVHRLWDALAQHGYGSEDIEKIAWQNARRVFLDLLR